MKTLKQYLEAINETKIDKAIENELSNYGQDELIDMIFTYGIDKGFDEDSLDDIESFDKDELIDIILSDMKLKDKEKLFKDLKKRK